MAKVDQQPFFLSTVWLQSDDHARHSPNLVRCTQGWALKRRQAVIFLVRLMGYFSPLQSITLPSAAGSLSQRIAPLSGPGNGQMATWEPHSAAEYRTGRTWTLCYSPSPHPTPRPRNPPPNLAFVNFIYTAQYHNLQFSSRGCTMCTAQTFDSVEGKFPQSPFNKEKRGRNLKTTEEGQTCSRILSLLL